MRQHAASRAVALLCLVAAAWAGVADVSASRHAAPADGSLATNSVHNCPVAQLQAVIRNAYQAYPHNFDAQIQKIRADANHVVHGHWNVIIFSYGKLPDGMAWHLDAVEYKYCQTVYAGLQYVVWLSKCN